MRGIKAITYPYKTTPSGQIFLDVYLSGQPDSPVVIHLHGGALIWGTRKSINPEQLGMYLEAGFSVVSIDYRLAPETKLTEIVEDVRDALLWIRNDLSATHGISSRRVGVVGHSAGGYLALLMGTYSETRPKVIVAFYGYGDITGEWYSQPSDFYCTMPAVSQEEALAVVGTKPLSEGARDRFQYYLYCRQKGIWTDMVAGLNPSRDRDRLMPYCPAHRVDGDFPPTLLIHGTDDTDVPYDQSLLMAENLEKAGVHHELMTVRGAGHVFDMDMFEEHSQQAVERAIGFLKEHL